MNLCHVSVLGSPVHEGPPSPLLACRSPGHQTSAPVEMELTGLCLARAAHEASSETAVLSLVFLIRRANCARLPLGYC